jgi:hypothetical protein
MKVLVGSSVGRANKDFDSEYKFKLATNDGAEFTAANMPDFTADFYVENRATERHTASFLEGVKTGCSIDTDGTITAHIPGETFTGAGRLFLEIKTNTLSENFADTSFDDYVLIDTGKEVV